MQMSVLTFFFFLVILLVKEMKSGFPTLVLCGHAPNNEAFSTNKEELNLPRTRLLLSVSYFGLPLKK